MVNLPPKGGSAHDNLDAGSNRGRLFLVPFETLDLVCFTRHSMRNIIQSPLTSQCYLTAVVKGVASMQSRCAAASRLTLFGRGGRSGYSGRHSAAVEWRGVGHTRGSAMLKVGKEDVFEREYTQKFRNLCAQFGEVVLYERDRAARDMGLHLSRKGNTGNELMSSAFCWFQLKGIQASTRRTSFDDEFVHVRLSLTHLQFWYLQPVPTHLVVYVEELDQFFVLNMTSYVDRTWGREVFSLLEKSVTVHVPRQSRLDRQAFELILRQSSVSDWKRALELDEKSAKLGLRDSQIIWQMASAIDRNVCHRVRFWTWLSKLRVQLWIEERRDSKWVELREHWEIGLDFSRLADAYPYLDFSLDELFPPSRGEIGASTPQDSIVEPDDDELDDEDQDDEDDDWDDDIVAFPGLGKVCGTNMAGEVTEFKLGVRLNSLGWTLHEHLQTLQRMGLLTIREGEKEWLSVAPWEHRSV